MVYWNEKLTRMNIVLRKTDIQLNKKYISGPFIENDITNLHMIQIDAIMR